MLTPGEFLEAEGIHVEENEIGVLEWLEVEGSANRWKLNLSNGHESFMWAGAVSQINDEMQFVDSDGHGPWRQTQIPTSMNPARRTEILTELKSLKSHSTQILLHRPFLHLEYRINHKTVLMDFDGPLSLEVCKLMTSLHITLQ